jgi:hypothetical protein
MRACVLFLAMITYSAAAWADCADARTAEERRACLVRERCPEARTDAERLACYERLLDEQLADAGERNATPGRGAGTSAAHGPENAEERFGLERRMRHGEAPELAEVQATIERIAIVAHRRMIFRLDNGQVWEETEARDIAIRPGDAVVVRRATFGSFRLLSAESNRGTTVRRIDCDDPRAAQATRRKCTALGL